MIAWFFSPFKRVAVSDREFAATDISFREFDAQIKADGGGWRYIEILDLSIPPNGGTSGAAIVKVVASSTTIAAIVADGRFDRIPGALIDDPLSSLTAAQKTAIKNKLLALGYPLTELNAAFPLDLGQYTLRDVLRFAAKRKQACRYDSATDAVFRDGAITKTVTPEILDSQI